MQDMLGVKFQHQRVKGSTQTEGVWEQYQGECLNVRVKKSLKRSFHNPYFLQNIMGIKLRRVVWVSHVACTGEVGSTAKMLTSKWSQVGDIDVDGRIILKWFKKYCMNAPHNIGQLWVVSTVISPNELWHEVSYVLSHLAWNTSK